MSEIPRLLELHDTRTLAEVQESIEARRVEGRLAAAERRAEAAEAKLSEIATHGSAITDALRYALSYVEHVPNPSSQAAAKRYRSALAITGTDWDAATPASQVREYRVLFDDEDGGAVLMGPCAYSIGCLFDRKFSDDDGVTLGVLIDAAAEHEGEQGRQAHDRLAGLEAEWDAAAEAHNAELAGRVGSAAEGDDGRG